MFGTHRIGQMFSSLHRAARPVQHLRMPPISWPQRWKLSFHSSNWKKMRTSYFLHLSSIFLFFHTFRSSSSIIFCPCFEILSLHKVLLLYFCSLTGTIANPSVFFCASLGAKDSHRISVPRWKSLTSALTFFALWWPCGHCYRGPVVFRRGLSVRFLIVHLFALPIPRASHVQLVVCSFAVLLCTSSLHIFARVWNHGFPKGVSYSKGRLKSA